MIQADPWAEFNPSPVAGSRQGETLVPVTPGRAPPPRWEDEIARARAAEARAQAAEERAAESHRLQMQPNPALTEGGRLARGFYERALRANEGYGEGVPPRGAAAQSVIDILPDNVERSWFSSEARRSADTFADEFIAATLRRESGAAIPEEEREAQYRRYFPVPGDSDEQIRIKAQLRQNALDALYVQAFGDARPRPRTVDIAGIIRDVQRQGGPAPRGGGGSRPTVTDIMGREIERPASDERLEFGAELPPNPLSPEQQRLYDAFLEANPDATADQLRRFARSAGLPELTNAEAIVDARRAGAGFQPGSSAMYPPPDISDVRGNATSTYSDPLTTRGLSPEDVDAFIRGAADVASVGFADEIAAAGDTIFGEGTYRQNLARQRAIDAYDVQNSPIARTGGQIAGAIALPSGVSRATFSGARTALRTGATRDAARIAARRAGVTRLTGEGAVYGGAYGIGSAEGDLGDRLAQGGVSALIGGAAAYGLGRGAGALLNRRRPLGTGSAYADRVEAAEAAAAAQRQGIDMMPADVGGPTVRRATAGAAQTTFGASPVIRAGRRTIEQGAAARDRIASEAGTVMGPEAAGQAAIEGARTFRTTTGRRGRALYRQAQEAAEGVDVKPTNTLRVIGEMLREEQRVPGGTNALPILERYAVALSEPRAITVEGARGLRTALRERLSAAEMTPSNADRITNAIMDAVGTDIEASLAAAGRSDAIALYREADTLWRERADTLRNVIAPIVGPKFDASGEQVVRRIQAAMQGNTDRIDRFVQALPAEEARTVRASLISQLGRATSGQQNAAGDEFSLQTFLNNWTTMQPRARTAVFGEAATSALNDLAKVAGRTRQSQAYANKSQTGGAAGLMVNIGTAAVHWPTFVASAAMQYSLGRMLASPVFARWLAKAPANPAQARSRVRLLSDIARTQPAISGEVLGLQQALLRQLGGAASVSPATRAAAEQEQ